MSAGGGPILAIDTATSVAYVALAAANGTVLATDAWTAGHRHGEELLARIDALLVAARVSPSALGGIAVGLGPGAFTGLRVGIATAKGLAAGLGVPVVGVGSGATLAAAAISVGVASPGGPVAILLPAGPQERTLDAEGTAVRLPAGVEPDLAPGTTLVAVDLDGRAPADALARGVAARAGFAAELARAGAARLRAGGDDIARLVPEYVTPPRGIAQPTGEVAWSRTRG
jgi:tRNA threonylcarbamoyl adenosine modification protein YeaZ